MEQIEKASADYHSTMKGYRSLSSMSKNHRWIKDQHDLNKIGEFYKEGNLAVSNIQYIYIYDQVFCEWIAELLCSC